MRNEAGGARARASEPVRHFTLLWYLYKYYKTRARVLNITIRVPSVVCTIRVALFSYSLSVFVC